MLHQQISAPIPTVPRTGTIALEDGGAGAEEGVAIHAHALQRAPREPDGLLPALRAPAPDTVGTHEPALLLTLSANRARQRGRGRHAAGRE